jgi:chromosome segregation ATPase
MCLLESNRSCSPIAGTAEQIAALRSRYQLVSESIAQLEARVAENAIELERLSRLYDDDDGDDEAFEEPRLEGMEVTDEAIEQELKDIRELEQRKQALEGRVTEMERDLGGLLR